MKREPFHRWTGKNELTPNEFKSFLHNDIHFTNWMPKLVTLHHTYIPEPKDWHGMRSLDNLEDYYYNVRKWHKGPHFFVTDKYWYIFCPPTMPGVHAKAFNSTAWGIETVWNGDASPFSGNTAKTLYQGLADIFEFLKLNPAKDLRFHRDDPKAFKTCPGLKVKKPDVINGIMSYYNNATKFPPNPDDGEGIEIILNGWVLQTKGIKTDGIVYAPLRKIATALGAQSIYIDSPIEYIGVTKDNFKVDLTDEVDIKNNMSWVSVRTLAESLGYHVTWNKNCVVIEG